MEVRRAAADDERLLRSLRIRALTDSPEAFGSTVEREESLTDDEWRVRLGKGATFFLEHDGEAVGLTGGVPHGGTIEIVSVWIDPAYRGQGGADLLLGRIIRWSSGRRLRLHVVETSAGVRRLYERHGFVASGHQVVRDRDGIVEVEYVRSAG